MFNAFADGSRRVCMCVVVGILQTNIIIHVVCALYYNMYSSISGLELIHIIIIT